MPTKPATSKKQTASIVRDTQLVERSKRSTIVCGSNYLRILYLIPQVYTLTRDCTSSNLAYRLNMDGVAVETHAIK